MENNYTNFAAGLPDANIPNNPFWSGVNQSVREQNMLPFMRNANVQSDLDVQTAQQAFQDAMSPEQRALRAATIGMQTTQANERAKTLPLEEQFKREEAQGKLSLLPQQNQREQEVLRQELSALKGKPAHSFLEFMSNGAGELSKLPPPMQAQVYTQLKDQWQEMNPGVPVPPRLAQYSPDAVKMLSATATAFANDPKLRGQLALESAKDAAHKERTGMEVAGRVKVAGIEEAGRNARNRETLAEGNPLRQQMALRNALRNPKISPEERETAESLLYRYIAKDMEDWELKLRKEVEANSPTPAIRETNLKRLSVETARRFIDKLNMDRIQPTLEDLRKAFPEAKDEQLKKVYQEAYEKIHGKGK
jgi:hypothetical protein